MDIIWNETIWNHKYYKYINIDEKIYTVKIFFNYKFMRL